MVVTIFYYVGCKYEAWYLKKKLNEARPSEHPLVRGKNVLGGINGCKDETCKYETCQYETSSWHLDAIEITLGQQTV